MSEAVAIVAPSVALREGVPADHAYVYATWLRGYRRHSAHAQDVAEATYTVEQHELIRGLLGRSVLTVAADADDPSLILGYVVSGDNALHWIHVKSGVRHLGIARTLCAGLGGLLWYSHDCDGATGLWLSMGLKLKYNPYRAWNP